MRSLEELLDQPLVLYFYPSDFTPGCTREACQFRDELPAFEQEGAHVVGVSPDPPEEHARFKKEHDLPFPLLSDEDNEVANAYGVQGILRTKRVTFVIDQEGTIRARIKSLLPGKHVVEAREAVEALST